MYPFFFRSSAAQPAAIPLDEQEKAAHTARFAAFREALAGDKTTINNVTLPQCVIDQLLREGLALEWYTSGELQDAVAACAFDAQLIDDPDDDDFYGRLHCSNDERAARNAPNFPTSATDVTLPYWQRKVFADSPPTWVGGEMLSLA